MNQVSLIGRLIKDPEVRFTQAGKAFARFTLAVDKGLSKEKKAEFEQKGMPTADFVPVVVWGRQAELCQTFLVKGRLVAINGSIQTGKYQANTGETRYTTDVLASNVEFIDWGEKRQSGGTYSQQSSAPAPSPSYGSSNSGLDDFGDFDSGFTTVSDDDDVPF